MENDCTCEELNRNDVTSGSTKTKHKLPNGSAKPSMWHYREPCTRKPTHKPTEMCESNSSRCSTGRRQGHCAKTCESVFVDAPGSGGGKKYSTRLQRGETACGGTEGEPWDEEILLRHIKDCRCTCDHMGYGNFKDWEEHNARVPLTSRCHASVQTPPCDTVADENLRTSYDPVDVTLRPSYDPRAKYDAANKSLRPGYNSCDVTRRPSYDPADPALRPSYSSADLTVRSKHYPKEGRWKRASDGSLKGRTSPESDRLSSTQRSWCLACLLLVVVTLASVGVLLSLTTRSTSHATGDHLLLVKRMLRVVPLIDGHNDLPWNIRNYVHNQLERLNFSSDLRLEAPWSSSTWSQTDLPRLRQGLLGAQFWSAYVPCEAQYKDAVQLTLEQINLVRRLTEKYEVFRLATSVQDIESTHRAGRIASLIGVEGGHSLGSSLAVLRSFYDLGVRYLTLTHTCNTPWADSSSASAVTSHTGGQGLTNHGKIVIREMNRLGMLVDLSHASLDTVMATLEATQSPVMFSHSSAQALCNTTRNVPDTVLKLMAQNGGLVMISFYNDFLTCSTSAKMDDVIRHVTYVRDVAGEDHVGLGAGYDGINRVPVGLEDVSKYPYLLTELLRSRAWSLSQVEKLAGKNFLRVFRRVEKVKEDMRKLGTDPYEEWILPTESSNKNDCVDQQG